MIVNKNKIIYIAISGAIAILVLVYITGFKGEGNPQTSALLNADEKPINEATCGLKGEIKFLNHNTYDNQDALFTYRGIDDSGRNIFWNVSPQDDIRVGPNIFNRMPIPDGQSLLGIVLPQKPKYKRYELAAKIQYGRLVDGDVTIFEKQCDGKTVVVLP